MICVFSYEEGNDPQEPKVVIKRHLRLWDASGTWKKLAKKWSKWNNGNFCRRAVLSKLHKKFQRMEGFFVLVRAICKKLKESNLLDYLRKKLKKTPFKKTKILIFKIDWMANWVERTILSFEACVRFRKW